MTPQMTPQEEQMLLAQILKQQGGGLQAPPVSLMPPSANTNPYGGGAIGNPYTPPAPAAGPAPDTRYADASADTTGQESGIAQQQRMAEALMAQSQNSPDLISAGRVSHAGASPMSALAQGISGWGAGKASKNAREGSKALEKTLAKKAEATASLAQQAAEAEAAEAARKIKAENDKLALAAANRAEDRANDLSDDLRDRGYDLSDFDKAEAGKNSRAKLSADSRVNQGRGTKPGAKAQEQYLGAINLDYQLENATQALTSLTPEQLDMANQPVADTAANMFLSDDAKRIADREILYPDPAVRGYRERVAKIESDFSKLASGLAVSKFEMEDRKNWSPYAGGLSVEDQQRRMERLRELQQQARGTYELMYPDYTIPRQTSGPKSVDEMSVEELEAELAG